MAKTISRRDFLKAGAAGTLSVAMLGATGIVSGAAENNAAENKAGLAPVFDAHGNKFEYGHFTAEAVVIDANKEELNSYPSFSLYHIMDYTEKVPYADSYEANGATDDNNTSSMYLLISENDALLVDLGNGAPSTASHFGEDSEDQAVLDQIDTEFRELVLSLADGRNLKIVITHQHGDHVGFSTAFEDQGYTVLYPEADLTDSISERFEKFDFQTFTSGEFQIPVGAVTVDTILCAGHSNGSTIYVINTPVITYNHDATKASATYLSLSGDAIGSGSSVWLFGLDSLKQLNENIDGAVAALESYTAFDAGLGNGEETGAKLLLLGGHGWQAENRFGKMSMDIEYARSMQNLIHLLSDGTKWRYDGVDGLSIEGWMKQGDIALKDAKRWGLYTAYFGSTLTSSAAITSYLEDMRTLAGFIPETEAE